MLRFRERSAKKGGLQSPRPNKNSYSVIAALPVYYTSKIYIHTLRAWIFGGTTPHTTDDASLLDLSQSALRVRSQYCSQRDKLSCKSTAVWEPRTQRRESKKIEREKNPGGPWSISIVRIPTHTYFFFKPPRVRCRFFFVFLSTHNFPALSPKTSSSNTSS